MTCYHWHELCKFQRSSFLGSMSCLDNVCNQARDKGSNGQEYFIFYIKKKEGKKSD